MASLARRPVPSPSSAWRTGLSRAVKIPRSIAYSPDGKRVTYLQSEHLDNVTALFVS